MDFLSKAKAVMIGQAVADALGVPVEFKSREEIKENPVVDMRGYGTHRVPKGTWSDDTSMALCALDAIARDGKIKLDTVMENFVKWLYEGQFTATGQVFDVGYTCACAIDNYKNGGASWRNCGLANEKSNGNGSLMRINPFVLYLHNISVDETIKADMVEQASALTHAHHRSRIGCAIYAYVLWELLNNPCKESVIYGLGKARRNLTYREECSHYNRLFEKIGVPDTQVRENEIKSTGYVVDTLEAAIWCLLTTNSYKECVLKAVNLGGDTDTVGAVAGGLAGALYGYEAIPCEWREALLRRNYIEEMCEKAFS